MRQRQHYLADDTHAQLVNDLVDLSGGLVNRDHIIEALGDAGIWPRFCLIDSLRSSGKLTSGVSLIRPDLQAPR